MTFLIRCYCILRSRLLQSSIHQKGEQKKGQHTMMTEKDPGMILVTGATGNIGKHLARQLAEMGQRTRVLVRDPSKFEANGAALEIVQGDLNQPDALEPAFRGV